MRRTLGIAAGLATHLLFAFTVWRLYGFLGGTAPRAAEGALWIDAALAATFGVVHSALLFPPLRERLAGWISPAFYGLFYCAATCGCLLLVFGCWRYSSSILWEITGRARLFVDAAFVGSWGALLYSLYLTGLGYQTGWTPWWHWLRKRPIPRRDFKPHGLYRWMRHPVYMSFLGLVWFTPVVSADRALLIAVWTGYLFAGSWLKDRRLAHYLGDNYRRYQALVPGYPGMIFGPLGRISGNDPPRHPRPAAASCPPVDQSMVAVAGHERQVLDRALT